MRIRVSNPVRHAVIGFGHFGSVHAQAADTSRKGALVAVVDSAAPRRAEAGRRFAVPTFSSHRELISSGIAESVSIALPHRLKDEVAAECLRSGLHAYVEKPLAIRHDTARSLVESAEDRGLQLTVGHQYRTFAGPRTLKKALEDEIIGDVQQVLWTWHDFMPAYIREPSWHSRWDTAGGGLLALQLAHDLDLLCWLFGGAKRVSATIANKQYGLEVEDLAAAVVEFESGAVAVLQASFNRPGVQVVRQIAGDRGLISLQATRSLTYDRGEDIRVGIYERPLISAPQAPPGLQLHVDWQPLTLLPAIGQEKRWKRPRRIWRKLGLYQQRRGMWAVLDSLFAVIRGQGELLVSARSALPGVALRNAMVVSAVSGKFENIPVDKERVRSAYEGASLHGLETRMDADSD